MNICRTMDEVVAVSGAKEANATGDRIYYELDGEGDADSSTTPGHNVDHDRDRKCASLFGKTAICIKFLPNFTETFSETFSLQKTCVQFNMSSNLCLYFCCCNYFI